MKQKVALKDKKKLEKNQRKFNDISSADEKKIYIYINVGPLFKYYKRQYIYSLMENLKVVNFIYRLHPVVYGSI
jgi:hypothetical protein